MRRAELFSDADAVAAGDTMPRRSPATTPTPTHPHYGSYIQPSDMVQVRESRNLRTREVRGRYRGNNFPFRQSHRYAKLTTAPILAFGVVVYSIRPRLFRFEAFYDSGFKKHATLTPVWVSISSMLYLEQQPSGQLS
jgi:lysozyme family protein